MQKTRSSSVPTVDLSGLGLYNYYPSRYNVCLGAYVMIIYMNLEGQNDQQFRI
jgi:hypothetical protein